MKLSCKPSNHSNPVLGMQQDSISLQTCELFKQISVDSLWISRLAAFIIHIDTCSPLLLWCNKYLSIPEILFLYQYQSQMNVKVYHLLLKLYQTVMDMALIEGALDSNDVIEDLFLKKKYFVTFLLKGWTIKDVMLSWIQNS